MCHMYHGIKKYVHDNLFDFVYINGMKMCCNCYWKNINKLINFHMHVIRDQYMLHKKECEELNVDQ